MESRNLYIMIGSAAGGYYIVYIICAVFKVYGEGFIIRMVNTV